MKRLAIVLALVLAAAAARAQVGGAPGVTNPPGSGTASVIGGAPGSQSYATLGAELLTNPSFTTDLTGWTAGANWAWAAGDKAAHTAGATATLAQTVTIVEGAYYQLAFTTSSVSAGTVSVTVGAQVVATDTTTTETQVFVAEAGGALAVAIVPVSAFAGNIDDVSLKLITPSPSAAVLRDGSGALIADIHGVFGSWSIGFGRESLRVLMDGGGGSTAVGERACAHSTLGYNCTGYGFWALQSNTLGVENVGLGRYALSNNTVGSFNTGVGDDVLAEARTGISNTAVGWRGLVHVTHGSDNTGMGAQSGRGITTGSRNVCYGSGACWNPAGLNPNHLATGDNNTYIGTDTGQESTTQRSNATAIGYRATVNASNYVTLGNSSVTTVALGGSAGAATGLATALLLVSTPFATLPADTNGTIRYCADCTKTTPCAGSGTGALAKRLNGAWDCN